MSTRSGRPPDSRYESPSLSHRKNLKATPVVSSVGKSVRSGRSISYVAAAFPLVRGVSSALSTRTYTDWYPIVRGSDESLEVLAKGRLGQAPRGPARVQGRAVDTELRQKRLDRESYRAAILDPGGSGPA